MSRLCARRDALTAGAVGSEHGDHGVLDWIVGSFTAFLISQRCYSGTAEVLIAPC